MIWALVACAQAPVDDTARAWSPADPLIEPSAPLALEALSTLDRSVTGLRVHDMNDDGHADVIRLSGGRPVVYFGSVDQDLAALETATSSGAAGQVGVPLDADGDGLSDVVVSHPEGVGIFLHGAQGALTVADADVRLDGASSPCVTLLDSAVTGQTEVWLGEWTQRRVRRLDAPLDPDAHAAGTWLYDVDSFGRFPGRAGETLLLSATPDAMTLWRVL